MVGRVAFYYFFPFQCLYSWIQLHYMCFWITCTIVFFIPLVFFWNSEVSPGCLFFLFISSLVFGGVILSQIFIFLVQGNFLVLCYLSIVLSFGDASEIVVFYWFSLACCHIKYLCQLFDFLFYYFFWKLIENFVSSLSSKIFIFAVIYLFPVFSHVSFSWPSVF